MIIEKHLIRAAERGNWNMIQQILTNESKPEVLVLFILVIAGILAKWFWGIGWSYLRDPGAGLDFGSWTLFAVRLALSLIAAALTFMPIYNKINQPTGDSWVPYILAFQNGFFWESALDAVM